MDTEACYQHMKLQQLQKSEIVWPHDTEGKPCLHLFKLLITGGCSEREKAQENPRKAQLCNICDFA